MDINILGKLLPTFERNQIKDNLKTNAEAINNELLPQFQNLRTVIASGSFKDKNVVAMSKDIVSYLNGSNLELVKLKQGDMLDYIIPILTNVATLQSFINKCIEQDFGNTVNTSALSFTKSTVLQLVDVIEFTAKYSSTLLNYISYKELTENAESNIKTNAISPIDANFLQSYSISYNIALRVLATPLSKLKADYGEIPDSIFDETTYYELTRMFGQGKTDPLGFSAVPFPLSLIYSARLNIAEWQMDRYDECVASAKATEYRILLYKKRIAEGSTDAALEKLLEANEKQLDSLKYKRAKLEKRYGLTDSN